MFESNLPCFEPLKELAPGGRGCAINPLRDLAAEKGGCLRSLKAQYVMQVSYFKSRNIFLSAHKNWERYLIVVPRPMPAAPFLVRR